MPSDWIVGFGSLLLPESVSRTVGDDLVPDSARAVRVKGFSRAWGVRGPTFTALSSHRSPQAHLNGLLFRVRDEAALAKLDAREVRYNRTLVPWENVELYPCHGHLDKGWSGHDRCWIYIAQLDAIPPEEGGAPLIQSYMDVCVAGALRISERFAEEFVAETWKWTHHYAALSRTSEWDDDNDSGGNDNAELVDKVVQLAWVNDRSAPRYIRAEQTLDHEAIDKVLSRTLGDLNTLRKGIEELHREEREAKESLRVKLGQRMREIAAKQGMLRGEEADGHDEF